MLVTETNRLSVISWLIRVAYRLAYRTSLSQLIAGQLIVWLIGWSHPGAAASGSAAGGGSPAGGGSAAAAARQRRRLGAGCGLKAGGAVAGGGQLGGHGSAGGDSAAGGGLATAALRSRFGGWRLGGRRLGGGGGLATAALRSQLGVCLSFSLSFSLSRSLSMLIPGHRHYLYVSTRVPARGLSNARCVSASGPVAPVIFSC